MLKINFILILISMLTGCVSAFEAIGRDPVRVEQVQVNDKNALTAVALSADKRNVIVGLRTEKNANNETLNRVLYCAEPPPEVAKAFDIDRSTNLTANGLLTEVEKEKIAADIKSKVIETITTLGQRTALLDVYRTATYSLCEYYMNGAIEKEELARQFQAVTAGVLAAFSLEAKAQEASKK